MLVYWTILVRELFFLFPLDQLVIFDITCLVVKMNTKESSEKDQKSLKRSRGSSSTKSSEESKRPKKVSKSDETSSEHEKSKSSKTSDKTAPEKKSNAKTIEKKQKTNSKESKGSSASSSSEAAKITKDKTINGGFGWKSTKPLPSRKANGVLVFDDFTDLQPNRTPKEILQVRVILIKISFTVVF